MTAIVFAWRPGCPHRERSFRWVRDRLAERYPTWEQVIGHSPDGPFNRSAAMLNGASRTDATEFVFHDADVWLEGNLEDSVTAAQVHGWAVPHRLLHRLSEPSTTAYTAGAALPGLTLDASCRRDSRPYVGYSAGTLVVLTRHALETAPPDRRFVGWGQEDEAWALALRRLVGPGWRGTADLVHLWHPAQPRQSRSVGSPEGAALLARYRKATSADVMRALIGEAA